MIQAGFFKHVFMHGGKAGIIKHVKATSQCSSRDMHVKLQWEMQHLGYLHSNVHNDNQEGQGIRRHIMVQ